MNSLSSEVVQSSERLTEIESKTDTVNEALKNIKSGQAGSKCVAELQKQNALTTEMITESALKGIDSLVNEMNDISKMMLLSVEKICKISENTDGLADEVKRELEEQPKELCYFYTSDFPVREIYARHIILAYLFSESSTILIFPV